MTRLETNRETFQTRSKAAHQITRDYGSELEDHLTDLEQLQKTGQIVSNLADLAKAMLARTPKAEDEMRQREDEAKSLRPNPARAKPDPKVDQLTLPPHPRAIAAPFSPHYLARQAPPFPTADTLSTTHIIHP